MRPRSTRTGSRAWSASVVHSVELLFDSDTEATVRRIWDDLTRRGDPQPGEQQRDEQPSARDADRRRADRPAVDAAAGPILAVCFPFACRSAPRCCSGADQGHAGAAGGADDRAARPARRGVTRPACHIWRPARCPTPMPGQWTPHVTLARRVNRDQLADALSLAGKPSAIGGAGSSGFGVGTAIQARVPIA